MKVRSLGRLWTIQRVISKYGLKELIPGKSAGSHTAPIGQRLRHALEELGPVFVKFGQTLSTRPDLLPADIAAELALLQDAVPPFEGDEAVQIVETALGQPVAELFQSFDSTPLASASVAQVHAARLKPEVEGEEGFAVVVKVLRPGIEEQIRKDIALMYDIARFAERLSDDGRRLRPVEVVAEFERVILDELDLIREGANATELRRNWLGSDIIYHPIVFWDYSRINVLVMERVYGISIDEISELEAAGTNFQVLAERGVEIFFKQVFRDNFFHADMHPGNIFVDVSNPETPKYVALDFGIVGALTTDDQRYLAENFLAFFNRDYRRVAELHVESLWVPEGTRVEDFEAAIRSVCEPIFNRPLKEISFGQFLLRLFQTARRFNMEVQPQLVLLQKTLLNIEGLGRQLYPDLDLWKTAKPILEDWMRGRLSPTATLERFRTHIPGLAETLPELAHLALTRFRQDGAPSMEIARRLTALEATMLREQKKNRWVMLGGVSVLAAALTLGLDGLMPRMIGDAPLAAWVFGFLAVVAFWQSGRQK